MKKAVKGLLFVICILTFIVGSGCSMSNESNPDTSFQSSDESLIQQNSNQSKQYYYNFSVMNSEDIKFSEGVSWFSFLNEAPNATINLNDVNYACIDKSGKMLFYVSGVNKPTAFENGYSHLLSNDGLKVSVINKNGEALSSYDTVVTTYDNNINAEIQKGDLSDCCVSYGYGYSVVQKELSNFNESNYEYIVYDPNKKSVYSFNSDNHEEIAVSYLGQGVFLFKNKGMFFSKSKKWTNITSEKEFSSGIDMVYFDTIYNSSDGDDTIEIQYLNSDGEIISTGVLSRKEYGWDSIATPVIDNISLIYDIHSDNYIIFDLKNDKLSKLSDTTYIDGITDDSQFFIDKDEVIITMKGKDGNNYVVSFDSEWNLYMMPTEYNKTIDENCGRVILDMDKVCNLDGRELFSLNEKWYNNNNMDFRPNYNDDVLIVTKASSDNLKTYAVLDVDGNEIFDTDKIDVSSSKKLEI